MKYLLPIFLSLLLVSSAFGERFLVATAFDTEDLRSNWSNEVVWSGCGSSVTLEWSPNSEPDLDGYKFDRRGPSTYHHIGRGSLHGPSGEGDHSVAVVIQDRIDTVLIKYERFK